MDPFQFLIYIIRPSLDYLRLGGVAAEKLLLGTALHESGGLRYIQQLNGPAVGIYQMEPDTYYDLCKSIVKGKYYEKILGYAPRTICPIYAATKEGFPPPHAYLRVNNQWATVMARMFYYRVKAPLPPHNDIDGLAAYYKKYWNTPKGKARVVDFIAALEPHLGNWA